MKISLASQIAAIESAIRGDVRLNRSQTELHKAHLQAARETLEWVRANETVIRATRKAGIGGRL